jgi:hypothetical protein
MCRRCLVVLGIALAYLGVVGVAQAGAAPGAHRAGACAPGTVGWDTYRHLDALPLLPCGVQTRQFSSFDRTGGNDDGFAGTYSCLRQDDGCVIAERQGPGEIDSIWFTRDGGDVRNDGNIKIELDGRTVLDAPLQDVVDGKLGAPFVHPLVANADESSGGVYVKVPMPFRRSMEVTTTDNALFSHVTYRQFASAEGVRTFDPRDKATDVLATLRAAGTRDPKPAQRGARSTSRSFSLAPGAGTTLADVRGPGSISQLRLRLPQVLASRDRFIRDDLRAFGRDGNAYSQFTAAIDPGNDGVRLTRREDTIVGHQKADVYVDGVKAGQFAGLPATPGPMFADESVDLPASLTAGKDHITIQNRFVSSDNDVNEATYWIDSHVAGAYRRTDVMDLGQLHPAEEQAHHYTINQQTFQGIANDVYPQSDAERRAEEQRTAEGDAILRDARIRISFDGRRTVDSPVGEFFGSGLGEYPVHSLFSAMQTGDGGAYLSWWPMPYARHATVRLYNGSSHRITAAESSVTSAHDGRWTRALQPGGDAGYFRASSHSGPTTPGRDWSFLDASGRGKLVGVHHTMQGAGAGDSGPFTGIRGYLEGDERVYADGSRSPQLHGTGTEDFYESGWYFNRNTFSGAFNGDTGHEQQGQGCAYSCDSTYRLMIADAVPFGSSLRFGIEHGPGDDVQATYGSTAFAYQQPEPALRMTDAVDVGADELRSSFEGDEDGTTVADDHRASATPVGLTLRVDPANRGVRLRRRSDQSTGHQSALVRVDGRDAGTWLEPLANPTHRWLEDDFELPAALTAGRSRLHVELVPTDGAPAWDAARYEAFSRVAPFRDASAPGTPPELRAAQAEGNAIDVTWKPARDDVGVDHYVVYGSRSADVPIDRTTRLGRTRVEGFHHDGLGLGETWHYRVRAVDAAGHAGPAAAAATATSGATLRVEAESLLPAAGATDAAERQGDCCGASWSGGAQLWFHGNAAGDRFSLELDVPQDGAYDLATTATRAADYGIHTLQVDGTQVGDAFDGYSPTLVDDAAAEHGTVHLTKGTHTLTWTVTGRNPSASGFFAGIDVITLKPADATAARRASAHAAAATVTQTPFERHEDVVGAGAFKRIYDPSVGEDRPWYFNDHAFIRDRASGRWHLYGITHPEPADPLHETLFGHATADRLTQSPWDKQAPAMQADGSDLEHYIWAPYVLHHGGRYWMFYAGGNEQHFNSYAIQLATSKDLVHWTRYGGNPLFRDGYESRDPMVLRVGRRWVMYYTATSDPNGGNHIVAYRTSSDLRHWSARHVALTDPNTGTAGGPTESPFVVRHGGSYYLFTCCGSGRDYGAEYMKTNVYRSRDPLHFDVDHRAGTIPAHAAEIVKDTDGKWYVSSAGWGKGGVSVAPLKWHVDQVTKGRTVTTPYYRAVVQTAPETVITSLGVDPAGQGDYRPALDSSWRPTGPYLAVGGFGDTDRPGPAAQVQPSADGSALALGAIPLGDEPATVDWDLAFGERSFDQSFRWHVRAPLSAPAWEAAWSWDTALAHVGDAGAADRPPGDVHGFGDWTMAWDANTTLVAAYERGSAWSEDNRYFDPPDGGVAWQPLWQIGGRALAPGDYAGGTWRIGASGRSADTAFADRLAAELNG